jgi:hypothetical protein
MGPGGLLLLLFNKSDDELSGERMLDVVEDEATDVLAETELSGVTLVIALLVESIRKLLISVSST